MSIPVPAIRSIRPTSSAPLRSPPRLRLALKLAHHVLLGSSISTSNCPANLDANFSSLNTRLSNKVFRFVGSSGSLFANFNFRAGTLLSDTICTPADPSVTIDTPKRSANSGFSLNSFSSLTLKALSTTVEYARCV